MIYEKKNWLWDQSKACYKLFTRLDTFDDANNFCKEQAPSGALTSNLLTLWDDYELLFGRSFLRDNQIKRDPDNVPEGLWLGLRNFLENKFC